MAKCVGSVTQWTSKFLPQLVNQEFLVENVRQGETAIKDMVKDMANKQLIEVGCDFTRIKQAAMGDDDFQLDSRQIQDGLTGKLNALLNLISSTVQLLTTNESLIPSTKHAYFIQFSYGIIERIQQLFQAIGRLSDIDQKLYIEEQRKLLVSDESVTIHSLTSIWTAMLEVLEDFCRHAEKIFNAPAELGAGEERDDMEAYDFLDELEFSTTRDMVARSILLDLIITSWIKFNRLVKYEDLVRSSPFLCPCNMKTFFRTLDGAVEATSTKKNVETRGEQVLCDLLYLILDHKRKPSLATMSVRRCNIVPLAPCYSGANKSDLAYFLIWHLHCLCTRAKSEASQQSLVNCRLLMEKSLKLVRGTFIADPKIRRLSSHQEERYKLLFHMLNVWCEQHAGHKHNLILLNHLFEFAHTIDSLTNLETKYFNNPDLSLGDSQTLFQLSAKLMSETMPNLCSADGQTQRPSEEVSLSAEQERLLASWNTLLDKHVHHERNLAQVEPQAATDQAGT